MKTKQLIGLIVAVVLFVFVGVASVFSNVTADKMAAESVKSLLAGGASFSPPFGDYIGVVKVEGTIQEQTGDSSLFALAEGYQHDTTMEYIDSMTEDNDNKGILLYVDSPGGTVYESAELYQKLEEYKTETGRPIWGYMSHYAASGGYYISAAADRIYANSNTTTGSIGVIMSGFDMTGLYKKLGIEYFSITSGEYKDSTQMTDEQIEIYQSQVDESYQEFVNVVATGRDMSEKEVKKLADGRTYTAKQAKKNGLIDEISSYEKMREAMAKEVGTDTFYELDEDDSLLGSLFMKAERLVPKSEAQVLTETAEQMESGRLMYYAE